LADTLNRIRGVTMHLGGVALALAVAAGIFWVGYDHGGYGLTSRGSIAVVVLWGLALAVSASLWPRARIPKAALLSGLLLAAFAAWTGLSALWAASAEGAFNELDRALLYLGAFALAVVAAARGDARRWLAGLTLGLTALGLLALVSRLFPNAFAAPRELAQIFPAAERRLSYPVDYWNGLATLVAFSLPLLLFFAVHARSLVLRGLALAPVPALAGTIYLTSSRGGSLAAGLATVTFVALTGRRWAAVGAGILAAIGSAGAVAVLVARSELVDRPHEAAAAVGQGHSAAVLIGLISLATGLVYPFAARFLPTPPRLGRVGAALVAGVLVAALAAGVVAARPVHRFEEFKEPPPASLGSASVQQHLLSGSSNGRWQLWESAVDEFESRPAIGRGAGSYEAWWAQHGSLPYFVRDAHSLYLETLGELGVVGLAILVAFLLAVLVTGVRRLARARGEEQSAVAALLALLVAYVFEAGVDWMWELTVVSVVAAIAAGLLTGPATQPADTVVTGERGGRRALLGIRAAAVAVAMALVVLEAIPLLSTMKIRQSQEAATSGDLTQALDDARGARSLEPWAASPDLQVALVFEAGGNLPAAIVAIREAVAHDESDWRLWLVAARLETKAGEFDAARASLARARALNPRSSLFAQS
jgi:tetratricopeptide (TPR) repeat protein